MTWDKRFIDLAEHIAQWSKDPSTKTAGVIVRPDKTIASVGFNGFPRNLADDQELLLNREEKYKRVIHSEMNALLNAKEDLTGFTLYQWPGQSCYRCAVHVIQAGISRVVSPGGFEHKEIHDTNLADKLYKEAGVIVDYV